MSQTARGIVRRLRVGEWVGCLACVGWGRWAAEEEEIGGGDKIVVVMAR